MSAKAARAAARERFADARLVAKYTREFRVESKREVRIAVARMRCLRRQDRDRGIGWIASAMREHMNSTALTRSEDT